MNAKRKRTRNEHRSVRLLDAAGYVAPASRHRSDIIGIGSTGVMLVQVKTRYWPGAVEMETLRLFPAPGNCRKMVHRRRDRQRLPDVKEL
jgi:hypothetical protein